MSASRAHLGAGDVDIAAEFDGLGQVGDVFVVRIGRIERVRDASLDALVGAIPVVGARFDLDADNAGVREGRGQKAEGRSENGLAHGRSLLLPSALCLLTFYIPPAVSARGTETRSRSPACS